MRKTSSETMGPEPMCNFGHKNISYLIGKVLNDVGVRFLMFGIGLCCGAYMLSYAVANDLSPPYALSTCAGFTNTMAIISAPLMQFIIGVGIDKLPFSTRLLNFQCALVLIPLSLLGAALIVMIAFTPTFSNLYQRIFSNHARSF